MRTAAGELLLFADDLAICKLKMSDLLTYFCQCFCCYGFQPVDCIDISLTKPLSKLVNDVVLRVPSSCMACSIKSGPLFAITFSNVDRFKRQLYRSVY